jgi:hypothetical protein
MGLLYIARLVNLFKDTFYKCSCYSDRNENVAVVNGENRSVPFTLIM